MVVEFSYNTVHFSGFKRLQVVLVCSAIICCLRNSASFWIPSVALMALSFRLFSCSAATTQTGVLSVNDQKIAGYHSYMAYHYEPVLLVTSSTPLGPFCADLSQRAPSFEVRDYISIEHDFSELRANIKSILGYLEKLFRIGLHIVNKRGPANNTDGGT